MSLGFNRMPSDSKAFLVLIFLHWLSLPKEVERGTVIYVQ